MPNVNLPTGNTVYISTYEWLFLLEEKDVDEFYQYLIAENAGTYIDDPFSNRAHMGKLEIDEVPEIDKEVMDDLGNFS